MGLVNFGFGKSGLKFLVSKFRSRKTGIEKPVQEIPEILDYKDMWRCIEPHTIEVDQIFRTRSVQ